MYYPDLSEYPDATNWSDKTIRVFSVGWLDSNHHYSQAKVPATFLEQLWIFCRNPGLHTLGYHQCSFCENPSYFTLARHGAELLNLGSAEIRVFGLSQCVYASPNLIYHYIDEHNYHPPQEFIEAVLSGPLPNSEIYQAHMQEYGWKL